MDRWPPLRETIGLAVGMLIVVSMAIGVIFLAQPRCQWPPLYRYRRHHLARRCSCHPRSVKVRGRPRTNTAEKR